MVFRPHAIPICRPLDQDGNWLMVSFGSLENPSMMPQCNRPGSNAWLKICNGHQCNMVITGWGLNFDAGRNKETLWMLLFLDFTSWGCTYRGLTVQSLPVHISSLSFRIEIICVNTPDPTRFSADPNTPPNPWSQLCDPPQNLGHADRDADKFAIISLVRSCLWLLTLIILSGDNISDYQSHHFNNFPWLTIWHERSCGLSFCLLGSIAHHPRLLRDSTNSTDPRLLWWITQENPDGRSIGRSSL